MLLVKKNPNVPVSKGGASVFSCRNMHRQSTSKKMMAMNSKPAPIPIIRIKFECLPLFEALTDEEVGDLYDDGAFTGDVATVGAVQQKQKPC